MNRFAHLSDIHLGAHRDPVLQKLELETFNNFIDKCIRLRVDFIVISGDFFHIGIPDLNVVNEALKKMRSLDEEGIPVYVVYGSHDFSPIGTTIIDLLDTVGSIKKIEKGRIVEGKLRLNFLIDERTGAKITGISGRKRSLEIMDYEVLDKVSLEEEDGFKIFVFHSGLTEFKPTYLSEVETIPLAYFPKRFHYYAGGHIHERGIFSASDYGKIVFPGPLFTGYGRDVEETAKGIKRGFYLVTFEDDVKEIEFVEIKSFESKYLEFNATGKNSLVVKKNLQKRLIGLDVSNKVIVLKVFGELSGGKTSDIDFISLKRNLIERGALYIHLNRYRLTSKETENIRIKGEDTSSIENNLFKQNIGTIKLSQSILKGEKGTNLAIDLLNAFRQEIKVNESKRNYLDRILRSGNKILNLNELLNVNAT